MNAIHSAIETTKQITSIDDEVRVFFSVPTNVCDNDIEWKIGLAAQSIRSSKIKLDFLKSFIEDPPSFVKTWLESQSRDLDIILGNEQGVREEDLKDSKFFSLPWVSFQ